MGVYIEQDGSGDGNDSENTRPSGNGEGGGGPAAALHNHSTMVPPIVHQDCQALARAPRSFERSSSSTSIADRNEPFFKTMAAQIKASRHALKQRDDHSAPTSTAKDGTTMMNNGCGGLPLYTISGPDWEGYGSGSSPEDTMGLPTSAIKESDMLELMERLTQLQAIKQKVDDATVEQTSFMRSTPCMMRHQSDPLSSSGGLEDMTSLAVKKQKASQPLRQRRRRDSELCTSTSSAAAASMATTSGAH